MVAAETRGRVAAQQASGSLPRIVVDDPQISALQAEHAVRLQETANFQLGGPEKLTGAHDPQHALQKNGGLADLWYMDDGDIMCHPILVPSFLHEFDVANATVGGGAKPTENEVIYHVNDLDAGPLEWRIRDVQNMCTVSAGGITLGVTVGPRQYIADQGRRHSSNARTSSAVSGPADGI